jgi:Uma2 family endonuclease
MSAATFSPPPSGTAVRPAPLTYGRDPSAYRFSLSQYQRMVKTGILGMADRVELLDGHVVSKMPNNPPHAGTVNLVAKRLRRHLPAGWDDRVQAPVEVAGHQPEPDVAVVRERADNYCSQHPTVDDTGLLVEVADSSLTRDQWDKASLYAEAGVPQYWVVNLPDERVEAYSALAGPTYTSVVHYAAGQDVPLVLAGVTVASIPAADLLP